MIKYETGDKENTTFFYPPTRYAHIIEKFDDDYVNELADELRVIDEKGNPLFHDEAMLRDAIRVGLVELAEDSASSGRRLGALGKVQKYRLLRTLDNEAQVHRKLLQFTDSLLTSTATIVILGLGYMAVWSSYLRRKEDAMQLRQDFPLVLHPSKFWTLVLDFALISYAQGTAGLICLVGKKASISVLGLTMTPWRMLVFNIIGLVGFPLTFIAVGAIVHSRIRVENVWSKSFNRHHDRTCFESKARYTLLKWVPVLNNFLTIEIKSVAPLSKPPTAEKTHSDNRLIFPEERRIDGPWDSADPKVAALVTAELDAQIADPEGGYEALNADASNVIYDKRTDRIKIDIDEPRYMENLYDSRNSEIEKKYPEAVLGYNAYHMKNGYDVPMKLDVEVQLCHIPPLMQTLDAYTFWLPRAHLQLGTHDKWNNLFGLSQRGNFFFWVIDRVAMVSLILTLSIWQDSFGIVQTCIAGAVALCLAGLYLPSAIASGVGKWHKLMEDVAEAEKKAAEEKAKVTEDEKVWPFEDEAVMQQFQELRQRKNDRRWFGTYKLYRVYVKEPVANFLGSPFWNTRAAVTAFEIVFGPVFTESMKAFIMISSLGANRSMGLFGNRFGSFFCMMLAGIAVTCLNKEALGLFWKQFIEFNYELFIWTRRCILLDVDWVQSKLSTNFIIVRDFTVWNVKMIQNEFGIHTKGTVRVGDAHKDEFRDSEILDKRRFMLHKTLYQVRPTGAFREDMDKALPVCLPLKDIINPEEAANTLGRLAGTVQIVNHTATRYNRKSDYKHKADDDSYFSLYTNPQFIPPVGKVHVRKGHGYSVRYNGETNQLFIRGPGIVENREYRASAGASVFDADGNRSTSSATARSSVHEKGTGTAQEICTEAGVLVVRVPKGQTPSLYHNIDVRSPNGTDTIRIDPNQVNVIYDQHTRSLYLRARGLYPSRDPYTVTWRVRCQNTPVRGSGVAHEIGVLVLQLEEDEPPRLDRIITLKDDQDNMLEIDPTQTDKYQVTLPGQTYSGFFKFLQAIGTYVTNAWYFVVGRKILLDATNHAVPCTVVQCTNPVEKTFRVEPNFHAAARILNAKLEETRAKVDTLDDPTQLGVVAFSVMTSGEFAQFFSSRGVDILHEGRWVNPLMDATHPIFRDKYKLIRDIEPQLRQEVEARFMQRVDSLETENNNLRLWIRAYSSAELYEAQLQKDVADYGNETDETMDMHIRKVRALKGEYDTQFPGFVYPLAVDSKLISRRADVEAQVVQWRQQLKHWLLQEENANRGDLVNKVGNSHFECILSEIMRALMYTFSRPEDLSSGCMKSILHFVCNSKSVRGQDFAWRPDPLSAHPAWVRVWPRDDSGKPMFDAEAVWLPCSLKLSGTSLKMIMPHVDDATRDFYTPHEWKHVTGWYVPLAAFEKAEVVTNALPPVGAHPYMKTTDTKIVFRKNQQIRVDDNYVRRIEDDHFLNLVQFDQPNGGPRESCLLMIGHCVPRSESPSWPSNEVDPTIVGDDVNVHPLTFRFNSCHAPKWLSAIKANRLANFPEELDKDFDGRTKESSEVIESEIESSYEYETETTPEEDSVKPPSDRPSE
eukprot:GHVO01050456.1.p1 GENE.GHVO01050456.1~~GHVO01050456.1.p1  ORF type:complete len:1756 (-),score=226.27 GHVO01050456.1:17-4735(-)